MQDPSSHVKRPRDMGMRRDYILERDEYKCTECGGETGLQVHHIMPVSEKPDHSEDNLITLCIYCHSKKDGRGHGRGLIEREVGKRCKENYYTKRISSLKRRKSCAERPRRHLLRK